MNLNFELESGTCAVNLQINLLGPMPQAVVVSVQHVLKKTDPWMVLHCGSRLSKFKLAKVPNSTVHSRWYMIGSVHRATKQIDFHSPLCHCVHCMSAV